MLAAGSQSSAIRRLFGRREKFLSHEVISIMRRFLLSAVLVGCFICGLASNSNAQFGGTSVGGSPSFSYGPGSYGSGNYGTTLGSGIGFGVGHSAGYRSAHGSHDYGPLNGVQSSYYGGLRGGFGGSYPSHPGHGRVYSGMYRQCH